MGIAKMTQLLLNKSSVQPAPKKDTNLPLIAVEQFNSTVNVVINEEKISKSESKSQMRPSIIGRDLMPIAVDSSNRATQFKILKSNTSKHSPRLIPNS
jgi:hypothetical protein